MDFEQRQKKLIHFHNLYNFLKFGQREIINLHNTHRSKLIIYSTENILIITNSFRYFVITVILIWCITRLSQKKKKEGGKLFSTMRSREPRRMIQHWMVLNNLSLSVARESEMQRQKRRRTSAGEERRRERRGLGGHT